jgi:hypothetical protein
MIERERSGGGERVISSWEIHICREREVTGEREWDRDGGREREREREWGEGGERRGGKREEESEKGVGGKERYGPERERSECHRGRLYIYIISLTCFTFKHRGAFTLQHIRYHLMTYSMHFIPKIISNMFTLLDIIVISLNKFYIVNLIIIYINPKAFNCFNVIAKIVLNIVLNQ